MANEQHTIIFVDDESIIRDGMETRVPWVDYGFQLVGVFSNGAEALEYLKDNPVDLVLSDISMPRMDGLELSRNLNLRHPETTIILLTGYDDFEYAQEAIKYGIKELLLKPITAQEIGAVLTRVRVDLLAAQAARAEERIFRETLETTLPILRERFLLSLVLGYTSPDEALRRRSFYRWEDRGQNYLIAIVEFIGTKSLEEIVRVTTKKNAEALTQEGEEVFLDRSEDLVMLFQGANCEKLEERAKALGRSLIRATNSGATLGIGIGPGVESLHRLTHSYNEARSAADRLGVLGLSGVLDYRELKRQRALSPVDFHALVRTLLKQLREESAGTVMETLESAFEFLQKSGISKTELEGYMLRLQFSFLDFFEELDQTEAGDDDGLIDTLRTPQDLGSLAGYREFFRKITSILENHVESHRNNALTTRIQKAKEVIGRRYKEKKFSLQEICDELYLSVSQFSALFKTGTGMTFVEYLTTIRVRQAKHLLKTTDLKSFEIAEEVGYEDPRYFSVIFKKHTGSTPQEFRKACRE